MMNNIMDFMDQAEVHYTRALAGSINAFKKAKVEASPEALNAGAATILIHARDISRPTSSPSSGGGYAPKRKGGQAAPESCPKCGGDMWDNTNDKRNPRAPDYKCKDKDCDGAVWLDSKKSATASTHRELDEGMARAVAVDEYDPFADE